MTSETITSESEDEGLDPFHFEYPSPFPVVFKDDDVPLSKEGSLDFAWSPANDFMSAFDDEATDSNESEMCDEIDEFVKHQLYLESRAYLKTYFRKCMKDILARGKPAKRKNRHKFCGLIGCPGLGGDVYCPKFKASMPKKDGGLITNTQMQKNRKDRQCQVCLEHGPNGVNLNCVTGSSNRSKCRFFLICGGRKCRFCQRYDRMGPDCGAGLKQTACKRFDLHGIRKVQT